MTSPNHEVPSGGMSSTGIQDMANMSRTQWEQDQAAAIGRGFPQAQVNFGDLIGQTIQNIANAFLGNFTEGEGPLQDISDGQRALNDDLSQLKDIPGYCYLTMSRNYRLGTGFNFVGLPFDTYIGPHKHAEHAFGEYFHPIGRIETQDYARKWRHAIVFTKPGLWVLRGQVTVGVGNTHDGYSEAQLHVRRDNTQGGNEVWSSSRWATRHDQDFHTYTLTKPVLIPDDGWVYYALLEVRDRDTFWWPYQGGAQWSMFSAERRNQDVGGSQPADTVPDGGDYQ